MMMRITSIQVTRCCYVLLLFLLLEKVVPLTRVSALSFNDNINESNDLYTPKFAAINNDECNVLNVHLVPHTHDDVGWLKTVEQYFFGFNKTIQRAHVQAILDSTIAALLRNQNRTFTYVETKFFSMWWSRQSSQIQQLVKQKLIHHQTSSSTVNYQFPQLDFANGGWCMHDEASTHFMGQIDQTTLGHDYLKRQLNVIPQVGWQLDPFGHAATQASLLTARTMPMNALYFGRIDYQDLALRKNRSQCEGFWSPQQGKQINNDEATFWGLTGSFSGNYYPPNGYCFDENCVDPYLVGLDHQHLVESVTTFLKAIKVQSDATQGNHVMVTMGGDFNYENGEVYFQNNDILIHSIHDLQKSNQINISSIFGPRFQKVNIFYSNPTYYTLERHAEWTAAAAGGNNNACSTVKWETKTDDFFPYADSEHAYWTGYFTSRTGFKRLERVGSSFLLAARQMDSLNQITTMTRKHQLENKTENNHKNGMGNLYDLEDALGISQHHDAVSGTAKQHVANDYAKRLQAGIDGAASQMSTWIKKQLLDPAAPQDVYFKDFSFCQRLNETTCKVSENASRNGHDLYVFVYNALGRSRSTIVKLPVYKAGTYTVSRADGNNEDEEVNNDAVAHQTLETDDKKYILYFSSGTLPATGGVLFVVRFQSDHVENMNEETTYLGTKGRNLRESNHEQLVMSNEHLQIETLGDGTIMMNNIKSGLQLELHQQWGFYKSYDKKGQHSGAYIFRPSRPDEALSQINCTSTSRREVPGLVSEIHSEYDVPWLRQVARLYKNEPYLEVEYTVGPISIEDDVGKEIVTRYLAPTIQSDGVFYTDANGRTFQRRVRSSRPSWPLKEHEPVAGNYYPVNAAIYVEDKNASMAVVTDRTLGGSSLFDGSIELMVQRRTLVDDARGVGEALNETVGGMTPYPPYGKAKRLGEGIIITGKHRLLCGPGSGGASMARSEMDATFSEPLLFVSSERAGTHVPLAKSKLSLISSNLPPNVILITFAPVVSEPSSGTTTFLIRLGHAFAPGEDENLSRPVTIGLSSQLFGGRKLLAIQEMSLTANQGIEEWHKNRLRWKDTETINERRNYVSVENDAVELEPMEIRTFHVQI